ncbi:cellulose binding domain-containing protein [Actinoplanes sp. HUAS TT8]|uniref:cellulose binding domain-containing protein n=1 Tax=Actinoplanes sp. HUAS TT8 TaxID=3447453 RepID=UPI003F5246B2
MSAQSKHRDRQFFLARGVFGLAAAILVGLVVFIAVRAGGDASASENPVIVQPSANLQAAESTTAPLPSETTPAPDVSSAPISPSASASKSPSSSPSASASSSPTPSKSSSSPKPSKTSSSPKPSKTTPPVVNDLSATCSVSSWGRSFLVNVKVTNRGSQAHNFEVTVSFPDSAKVTGLQGNPWNAQATSVSSSRVVLRGSAAVGGGGTANPGFIGNKKSDGDFSPTGCSVAVVGG